MKKKSLILCMAAIIVLLPIVSCGEAVIGSGNTVTKTYDYNNFTGIEAHQGFQVELIKSNDFNIEVTVDDNIIEYLIVEKSDDTLILRLKHQVPGFLLGYLTNLTHLALFVLHLLKLILLYRVHLDRVFLSQPFWATLS